jgi:uncharacterized protein
MRYVMPMLFQRREPATWRDRARNFFWPRKGLDRPFRYIGKRILRRSASPHAVATGVAVGTLSAFTPFLGLHVVLAVAVAHVLAGDLLAAMLATALANPLTLPFILAGTFHVGEEIMGTASGHGVGNVDLAGLFEHLRLFELWEPVLQPMLVGSLVLGLPAAASAYGVTRIGVRMFRHGRQRPGPGQTGFGQGKS